MTLRARLVLVVLALITAGLVVSGLATSAALHSYLLGRVDEQLRAVQPVASRLLLSPPERAASFPDGPRPFGGGDVLAARITADGTVTDRLVPPFSTESSKLDAIPASLLTSARAATSSKTDATVGGEHYEVITEPIPGSSDVIVLMAPLHDVDATLQRLQLLEIAVGTSLLAAASGAALWLVRVGLRPLHDMADTADAIADGQIERRVDAGGGGEVTRLAHALNGAFDARQASEDLLRRFVTDASHELRTPLTSIRGYAELYRAGALADPEAAARAVQRIEEEAGRMGELVDDLLLLARIDQGRPLLRGPVDLSLLAADAVADAAAVEPDRPITLRSREPVVVEGDEGRVRQIFANLLTNVREHTPKGTAVEVAVRVAAGEGVLEVTDEGPGLAADAVGRAFDRFWRADPSRGHRAGSVGGSGLGLSIVAAVAAAHGGHASVENVAGHGARFTVSFPLAVFATSSQGNRSTV